MELDLDLGVIQAGDIVSWVYTLTAQGATHGFERGYYAFVGDPFGGEAVTGNLRETIGPHSYCSDSQGCSCGNAQRGLASIGRPTGIALKEPGPGVGQPREDFSVFPDPDHERDGNRENPDNVHIVSRGGHTQYDFQQPCP